jgi:hypothetical protein
MKVLLMKCRPVFGYLLFLTHTDMLVGQIEIRVQSLHIAKISPIDYERHEYQCLLF